MASLLESAPATSESVLFSARDGVTLSGWHHRLGDCRSRVVLVHGFGEHSARYDHVVRALLAAGHECHLFDLRGHGASGGKRGHVPSMRAYDDDLERFVTPLHAERPAAPVVLLGHSLGGLIALSALLHRQLEVAALVVSSPFLAPAFAVSGPRKAALRFGRWLLPRASIPAELDPGGLSRDAEVVSLYRNDPRIVGTVTLAWAYAVMRSQEELLHRAHAIRLPALFLLGDADPVADPAHTRVVFDRLASSDKDLRLYPGFRHEVLNEIGKEAVLTDLLTWLAARLPQRTAPLSA